MKTILKLECPYCGAPLEYEEGREQMFCQYCGKKILLVDENTYNINHTIRHIDDARIKETEAEKSIRLKELELEEKLERKESRARYFAYGLALVLFLIGMINFNNGGVGLYFILAGALIPEFTFIGNEGKKKEVKTRRLKSAGYIVVEGLGDIEETDYSVLEAKMESLGFYNIKTVPLRDIGLFGRGKNGKVCEISIGGEPIDSSKGYNSGDKVIITYHSTK